MQKFLYILLLMFQYSFSANYQQVAHDENDIQRRDLIKRLHKRDSCGCCAPDYARLCCMSPASKQMLEELYYEGGPWDQEGANVCKKSLIACRKKGCGCEHAMWAFGCSCLGLTVSEPFWLAGKACGVNQVLLAVLDSLAAWTGCTMCPESTKSCDTWLSNPQNWPPTQTMSEDDENDELRETIDNGNVIGFLTDSSSDYE